MSLRPLFPAVWQVVSRLHSLRAELPDLGKSSRAWRAVLGAWLFFPTAIAFAIDFGNTPRGVPHQSSDGAWYVTAEAGGANAGGTLVRVTLEPRSGRVLHAFAATGDGSGPRGELLEVTVSGKLYLYGITQKGGTHGKGTIYRIQRDGTDYSVVHSFAGGAGGANPRAGLTQTADGQLWGTCFAEGANGGGTVFRLQPDGSEFTVAHAFGAAKDGKGPEGRLLLLADAGFYGTTSQGGARGGGTVFTIGRDGSGYQLLCEFDDIGSGSKEPVYPRATLLAFWDGYLYSTSMAGGVHAVGTVFRVRPDGSSLQVVHHFLSDPNFAYPTAGLIVGPGDWLYGCTTNHGTNRAGTVFALLTPHWVHHELYSLKSAGVGAYADTTPALGYDERIYFVARERGPFGGGSLASISPWERSAEVVWPFGRVVPVLAKAAAAVSGSLNQPLSLLFDTQAFSYPDATVKLTYVFSGLPDGISYSTETNRFTGTPTKVGTFTVTVTAYDPAAPSDTASTTLTFTIGLQAQTISFAALPDRTVDDPPFDVSATASSGLPVTFTIDSGPATLSGNRVTLTGAGTVVVSAHQAGSAQYSPASVQRSFQVAPLPASVTLSNLIHRHDGTPKQVTVHTVPAGLNTTITYNGSATAPASAGMYSVQAVINDNRYSGSATATLTIHEASIASGTYWGPVTGVPGRSVALVRADGTGLVLVTTDTPEVAYVAAIHPRGDGAFDASSTRFSPSAQSGPTLQGSLASASLRGALVGTNVGFDLSQTPAGSGADACYKLLGLGTAKADAYLVTTRDGRAFVLCIEPTDLSWGEGTVRPDGTFAIATNRGAQLTGVINPANGQISASLTRSSSAAATLLAGLNDELSFSQRFINISTRGYVGTGDNVLIAGFFIHGTTAKQVLLRAAGPSLAKYNVTGVLARPKLEIYRGQSLYLENQGWDTAANASAVRQAFSTTGAFAFPEGSEDSAALVTLSPGAYTAIVRGVGETSGIALVEAYEVGATPDEFINVSTRGYVGPNERVLIAGFVVSGNFPKRILARAVGPSLTRFGIATPVADPAFRIMQGNKEVARNDNWEASDPLNTITQQVGAFALTANSKDAAMVITLTPGLYSIVVEGVDGSTGPGLVEVYAVP
jgi:uncharacterized repeat protein (TIGR03803 family)